MRLFCTYLGMTVTDAWKLYRDSLPLRHHYKEIGIVHFSNIVCKTLLLNDYNNKSNESFPKPTLGLLTTNPASRSLSFPDEVDLQSPTNISSLESSRGNLINLGNGRYISAHFVALHQHAICEPCSYFVQDKHAFGGKRRVRGRCKTCGKAANSKCSACDTWQCNPRSNLNRFCFESHKAAHLMQERLQHYEEQNS